MIERCQSLMIDRYPELIVEECSAFRMNRSMDQRINRSTGVQACDGNVFTTWCDREHSMI